MYKHGQSRDRAFTR